MTAELRVRDIIDGGPKYSAAAKPFRRVEFQNANGDVFLVWLDSGGRLLVRVSEGVMTLTPESSNAISVEAIGWAALADAGRSARESTDATPQG